MNKPLTLTFLIITLFFTSCKDPEVSKKPKKETPQVKSVKKVKNYDHYVKTIASLLLTNGKSVSPDGGVIKTSRFNIQKEVFLCDIKTDELITPSKVQVTSIEIDQKSINNQAVIKGSIVIADKVDMFREFEVILKFDGEIATNKKISDYELIYSDEQNAYKAIEVL